MRKLAAIMFTDIVGYTALSQKDEVLALELLEEHRQLLRPLFGQHKFPGDQSSTTNPSVLKVVS
jgi:class 3 adenylate cyclase